MHSRIVKPACLDEALESSSVVGGGFRIGGFNPPPPLPRGVIPVGDVIVGMFPGVELVVGNGPAVLRIDKQNIRGFSPLYDKKQSLE